LYFWNGKRPGLKNYTVEDYVGDYQIVFNQLKNTSSGDILAQNNIGGPTICCAWVINRFGGCWAITDPIYRTLPRFYNKASWSRSNSNSST